jgi:hypothetical protein
MAHPTPHPRSDATVRVVSQSSPLDVVVTAVPSAPNWGSRVVSSARSRKEFLSAVVMGAAFWVLEVLHEVGSSLESEYARSGV